MNKLYDWFVELVEVGINVFCNIILLFCNILIFFLNCFVKKYIFFVIDHRRRNKTATTVLFKWGQLQGGEDENIFPHVDGCDQVFNSILPYEIPVLKVFSKPLIQTITPNEKQYKDAQNLLAFLDSVCTFFYLFYLLSYVQYD